jgi:hypothetical protein
MAKWDKAIAGVMVVSGVLTCSMIYPAIAPGPALQSMFGETIARTDLSEIIVRNWGVLITLVGAMLIYGAFRPPLRAMALSVAIASKIAFISLVLTLGSRFLSQQVGIALAVDAIAVVVLGLALVMGQKKGAG